MYPLPVALAVSAVLGTAAAPIPRGLAVEVEAVGRDVVLLPAPRGDLELREVRVPAADAGDPGGDAKGFAALVGKPLHPLGGVSSSGLGTFGGTRRPPIHFATVTDRSGGRAMRLYVVLASDKGFIHRSGVMWADGHIPGVQAAVRMHNRAGTDGQNRMTAEVQIRLPGGTDTRFVFVGYDAAGGAIPPFGPRPFRDHVAEMAKKGARD